MRYRQQLVELIRFISSGTGFSPNGQTCYHTGSGPSVMPCCASSFASVEKACLTTFIASKPIIGNMQDGSPLGERCFIAMAFIRVKQATLVLANSFDQI